MKKLIETTKGKFIITDNLDDINRWINNSRYTYICQVNRATEKEAKDVVHMTWINDIDNLCKFKNYNPEGKGSFSSALESLNTLFELHNIQINKNTFIFRK